MKLVFLASECVRPLSKIYVGSFPASPDTQVQDNCRPLSFDPTRSASAIRTPDGIEKKVFSDSTPDRNHVDLIWIEKVPTVISCNSDPIEQRGKHSQIDSRERSDAFWGEKYQFPTLFRGKGSCERAGRDFFQLIANPTA